MKCLFKNMGKNKDVIENGFKLIAIRPLPGTKDSFLKNLKSGCIYKFYQDYKFLDEKGEEILFINGNLSWSKPKVKRPNNYYDLYSNQQEIKINISAIVGENGSGKSSLIDLFNLITYYLSAYEFKTIINTRDKTFNELHSITYWANEYLLSISKIITDWTVGLGSKSYRQDDLIDLNHAQLIEVSKEISNKLNNLWLTMMPEIGKLKTEDSFKLKNELCRYLSEGSNNYDINIKLPFLTNNESLFEHLNSAISARIKELLEQYDREDSFNNLLRDDFNFQIFYEKNGKVESIEKIKDTCHIKEDSPFYTILLNYSLHSMNSNYLGQWIHSLFHKNDGYQTPIVINPYREEGLININSEVTLSIDRLFYNIVDQLRLGDSAVILSKYKFKRLILKPKTGLQRRYSIKLLKEKKVDIANKSELIKHISHKYSDIVAFDDENDLIDLSISYLAKKFNKISNTYIKHFYEYKPDLSKQDLLDRVENLDKWNRSKTIKYLESTQSHITRKFDQTYNFIVNYEDYLKNLTFIENWNLNEEISISNEELIQWLDYIAKNTQTDRSKLSVDNILINLFPAIFTIDIEFEYNEKEVKLSDLSSGEQQYLFNLNTIIYHINNLKSIRPVEGSKLRKYDHVNVILDEIELYYHPQFQKQFINDILKSIQGIEGLEELRSFNLIFLTHSPFILSDIPSANTLVLKDGAQIDTFKETFGSNIHDLLHDEFFLKDGFIGDFSRNKINETIRYLALSIILNRLKKDFTGELSESQQKMKKRLEEDISELKNLKTGSESIKDHHEVIKLVGEPILRKKLDEMYDLVKSYDHA